MSIRSSSSHALLIARVQLLRGWRSLREKNTVQQVILGATSLLFVGFALAAGFFGMLAGEAIRSGRVEAPLEMASYVPAGLGALMLIMTAYVTVIDLAEPDQRDALLTTVPHRDVVLGTLVAGLPRATIFLAGPLLIGPVGLAYGARSAATLGLTLVALVAIVANAYVLGFALGLGLKYLLGRSELVARYKTTIGILGFLVYLGVLMSQQFIRVAQPIVELFRASPAGWYADLGLIAIVPAASPVRAAGAMAGSMALLTVGLLASIRLSELVWYADPVTAETDEVSTERWGELMQPILDRQTAAVVRRCWLRARRAPIRLIYVGYPLFVLIGPVQQSVEAGRILPQLPALVAIYGSWATGALFTLNPLGDEGGVLPIAITSGISGKRFVGGTVIAGAMAGLPVTFILTGILAILSSLDISSIIAMLVAALVLPAAAPALASGIGVHFPRFEPANITRNQETMVPSTWAFITYSIALLVLAAPAIVLGLPAVADIVATSAELPVTMVRAGGALVSTILIAGCSLFSYRHAATSFNEYTK
ncbi:MAG: hypothetical protein ABEI52_03235 [Halobacteriaceae archaeon]